MISTALAQINNRALGSTLSTGQTGIGFFQLLIPNLITIALVLGSIVFVFMVLIGAIKWISAGGDKAQLESAQKTLQNGLVGLTVMFSTWAIIQLAQTFFGIPLLSFNVAALFIP